MLRSRRTANLNPTPAHCPALPSCYSGTNTQSALSRYAFPLPSSQPSPQPSSQPSSPYPAGSLRPQRAQPRSRAAEILCLLLVWAIVYAAALFAPPLLDDADATHAQAAQAMLRTGDWVTLHVNGIRYLEKPPLPYWLTALSLRLFGKDSFAVHLPLALTMLALAGLAWLWGNQLGADSTAAARTADVPSTHAPPLTPSHTPSHAPSKHGALPTASSAGFYAALFTLTAAGAFLFTRIFIPEALLSLLLAFALYAFLRALDLATPRSPPWALAAWFAMALAVLTKGFIALVFLLSAALLYLLISGEHRHWRRLHPALGSGILLLVAAPWHILAGLRNRGGADGHGFFWFYFINEHVLRFLGRRSPPDYNKLPAALYWSLHLVWLFPWSFFTPLLAVSLWHSRRHLFPKQHTGQRSFPDRSMLLLLIFSTLVLLFFSVSTNQEYYTFPVYLPLLLLTAAALASFEQQPDASLRRLVLVSQGTLAGMGLLLAGALAFGLWSSRHLPPLADVGDLLAHRGVGDYTLSMSHFFDLTTASFSALRLPAALAALAFGLGPGLSFVLRQRGQNRAATLALGLTSTVFLVAAHIALVRFGTLLSSQNLAATVQHLEGTGAIESDTTVLLYGDQALGSSIPFYLGRPVLLVDGRSTSMLFGSTFPDAPPIFLTHEQLQAAWGHGPRKILFVPLEHHAEVLQLLGPTLLALGGSAGKALYTDRPLALSAQAPSQPQGRTAHTVNP